MEQVTANVTPLGVASLAITTVVAPTVAWLVRNGARLLKKQNVQGTKLIDLRKDVDALKTSCETADRRLIKLEEALAEIKLAGQRSETQLGMICGKLDALPRLDATIQAQAAMLAKIVPRDEVERAFGQHEQRIALIEQDIRK